MTLIAVTGATGFVGQALLDQALEAGIEVHALARQPQEPRKGVKWIKGDLADKRALNRLVKGVEAVIHVAGVVNAPDPAGFEAGNVAGTLAVVEAAVRAGVPRFLFVSSLSAREPDLSAYGASKARAEKIVKSSALDWTIVRPPAIYGPRDREMFELFRIARWGVLPMPPKEGRASLIHVDDLARLLLALVPPRRTTAHKVFEPDDGRPGGWSHYELARAIGWSVGRRPWVLHLPKGALEWVAKVDGVLRKTKAKLTPDRVGYMTHPDWTVSDKARVPVKLWEPQLETREGLRATAEWYREQRWL
jgi:uncharacterized protein YbjT (DUF2867 family)